MLTICVIYHDDLQRVSVMMKTADSFGVMFTVCPYSSLYLLSGATSKMLWRMLLKMHLHDDKIIAGTLI